MGYIKLIEIFNVVNLFKIFRIECPKKREEEEEEVVDGKENVHVPK